MSPVELNRAGGEATGGEGEGRGQGGMPQTVQCVVLAVLVVSAVVDTLCYRHLCGFTLPQRGESHEVGIIGR